MLKRLLFFTIIFFIASCKDNKQDESVLRVATSADHPPHEFYCPTSQKITGFDIELIREIGKRLHRKVIITDMDFSGIIPALQHGRVDCAIASIARTDERAKNIDFTQDYYVPRYAILSLKTLPLATPKSFEGHRIGAQLGTSHEIILYILQKEGLNFEIASRNRVMDSIQELLNNSVQGVVMDYIPAQHYKAHYKEQFVAHEFIHNSILGYAIALPKDSSLTHKINKVLEDLKKEGFIEALEKKWASPVSIDKS